MMSVPCLLCVVLVGLLRDGVVGARTTAEVEQQLELAAAAANQEARASIPPKWQRGRRYVCMEKIQRHGTRLKANPYCLVNVEQAMDVMQEASEHDQQVPELVGLKHCRSKQQPHMMKVCAVKGGAMKRVSYNDRLWVPGACFQLKQDRLERKVKGGGVTHTNTWILQSVVSFSECKQIGFGPPEKQAELVRPEEPKHAATDEGDEQGAGPDDHVPDDAESGASSPSSLSIGASEVGAEISMGEIEDAREMQVPASANKDDSSVFTGRATTSEWKRTGTSEFKRTGTSELKGTKIDFATASELEKQRAEAERKLSVREVMALWKQRDEESSSAARSRSVSPQPPSARRI
eukprot:TRINITY_DN13684_c1_g1_i1.p1 TRINITY_DN13684_c1_g1~~TRINITY_DN13684_c1_g1_i1.p1  ORF type:complete len:349 (-),score=89.81 TRINITY_DN13684_c1_g1_i1:319-1365(-)